MSCHALWPNPILCTSIFTHCDNLSFMVVVFKCHAFLHLPKHVSPSRPLSPHHGQIDAAWMQMLWSCCTDWHMWHITCLYTFEGSSCLPGQPVIRVGATSFIASAMVSNTLKKHHAWKWIPLCRYSLMNWFGHSPCWMLMVLIRHQPPPLVCLMTTSCSMPISCWQSSSSIFIDGYGVTRTCRFV